MTELKLALFGLLGVLILYLLGVIALVVHEFWPTAPPDPEPAPPGDQLGTQPLTDTTRRYLWRDATTPLPPIPPPPHKE